MRLLLTSKTNVLDIGKEKHFFDLVPANLTRLPPSNEPQLCQREAAMIDRLIDICICYEEQGQTELSEIVDRIGLTMTQAFLTRLPQPACAGSHST